MRIVPGAAPPESPGRCTLADQPASRGEGETATEALRPYRHLAMRVLALAVRDAANLAGSRSDRESARAFLKGSRMLRHWCRVAALDPTWVIESAAALVARARSSHL